MARYKGVDFYGMDALLSEEELMVRDSVRDFVSDRFMPLVTKHYREGSFPMEIVPELGELGLLGPTIPEYGSGLSSVAYGLVLQELERGDSGLRSFVSVQGALCMWPISAYGSKEQKERWLPGMARGELIGCFGLTEPDFGSNPGGMTTRAVDDGDSYVLNGTKRWITNGSVADIAVVWAKLGDDVRGFLVEKGTPGYSTRDIENKFSLRVSTTSELIFEDCRIPKSALLGTVTGLKGPLSCLTQARYGIAWGGVGAAQAVYDEALEYAKTRVQFSRPIGGYQLVQQKLVWMLNEITKGQLLVLRLGRLKDQGAMHFAQVSLAKRNNIWMALECARLGRDILGASGITDEYHVGRHMTNLESVSTYEGTHDIHTLILGGHITGLQAFE
ncbi:MAG: acyl-CoA dehydrogenase family protein [Planctomycetes bacterium]|nr:acyl-CoA dehydrogenase family protein [Planctomycetota bacterium]MCB9918346.1 acyl-CoA dehydrogenase family protein [Planctomycetota bacterium]